MTDTYYVLTALDELLRVCQTLRDLLKTPPDIAQGKRDEMIPALNNFIAAVDALDPLVNYTGE